MSTGGQSNTSPTCYILSDQNFPPVLPSNGIDNCPAIIRVEDASLSDLVTTFMRLTRGRGYDLGIGSFLLISSLNHLGRVGAAAYAEDLVSAFHNIETTFGGQIRALHGYPVCADTVSNQLTIRALMEIEAWLASSDQRRLHSLGRTSEYFTANFLSSKEDNKSGLATAVIPLRLPASLFSKERTSHVRENT